MALNQKGNPVYHAAERWIEAALRNDNSLFSPGDEVWSASVLEDVHRRFVDNPDEGKRSFHEKLRDQLDGAEASAYQLMAEALYIHLLPAANVTGDKKRQIVDDVLSWSRDTAAIPDELAIALDSGLFSVGMAYHTFRPFQLQLLLEFVESWKQLGEDGMRLLLDDPWEFKEFLFEIPLHAAQMQREALLHLVHPETFEDIVSQNMKSQIATRFADLGSSSDIDRKLLEIRQELGERYGPNFSFFDEPILEQWNPPATKWGQFAYWAERFYRPRKFYEATECFDEIEVDYKLAVSARVREALEMIKQGDGGWPQALKGAFTKDTNLTSWRAHTPFLDWCEEQPEEAARIILDLCSGEGDVPERVGIFGAFLSQGTSLSRGARLSIASVLTLGIDPEEYPPYRAEPFHGALKLLELPALAQGADDDDEYAHFLGFLDQVRDALAERNLDLRHRLDAQAVVWSVLNNGLPDSASEQEKAALEDYRKGIPPIQEVDLQDDAPAAGSIEALADELLLDASFLNRTHQLLRSKKQVIFYGPPGTGKTFVAQELARFLAGATGRVELVQFHPSYAYEDFVEGYRPALIEGTPGFRLHQGPLRRLADRASADQAATYILIIDEINRGNVAKVFGELYYLLEYRGKEMSLQYSAQPFSLPENLWIIGTMNTADRSIALVDAALRRRFFFVPFFPDRPPIQGLLDRWLTRHKPDLRWIADVVDRANDELGDRHLAIGPSYFMHPNLDEDWVDLTWRHSVIPYLEEHFFGEEHELDRFGLDQLRRGPVADETEELSTEEPDETFETP